MALVEVLKNLGFNPQNDGLRLKNLPPEQREQYFQENLKSTVNHLLDDLPASLPYYYRLSKTGEVVSYPSGVPLFIDCKERGGFYQEGLRQMLSLAKENPEELVFLYSPPGPVDFSEGFNPETGENYYKIGQLYLSWFDGEKFNNLALSISEEGGWLVDAVLGEGFSSPNDDPQTIKKIITRPRASHLSFDRFLARLEEEGDKIIYHNVHGETFTSWQVADLMVKSLAGRLRPTVFSQDKTILALKRAITAEQVALAYLETMRQWMIGRGVVETSLGGGCGGGRISLFSIERILSGSVNEILPNLSSSFRDLTQSLIPSIFSGLEKSYSFDREGVCRICHQKRPLGPCGICQKCDEELSIFLSIRL